MRTSIVVWIGLLLAAAAPAAAQDWAVHAPAGGGYRVEMPGAPEVRRNEYDAPIGRLAVADSAVERGGRSYMVSVIDFPAAHAEKAGANAMIADTRESLLEDDDKKIRSERRLVLFNHPALHLVVDDTADKTVEIHLLVVVKARLYVVTFRGPMGSEDAAETKRFVASFALVGQ